jgi:vitamin B12 transporter
MKKRYQQILCGAVGCSIVLLGTPNLAKAAEADEADFSLQEYIVTANRIPLEKEEIAANVTVIGQEQIANGHYSNAAEILKTQIPVEQDSTGSYPVINGDTRVLVLIDGRRVNWDQIVTSGSKNGVNLSDINADNIEKIEILHGPASSLYGSDAAGGVINIITQKATKQKTTISSSFGSSGYNRNSIRVEDKTENGIHYTLQYTKEKKNDFSYKDGKTGQEKTFTGSNYEDKNLNLNIGKDFSNGRSLSFDYTHHERSGGYNLTMPSDGYYYYPLGTAKGQDNQVAMTYQWSPEDYVRLYHYQSDDHNFSSAGSTYDVDRKANGADWQHSAKLSDKHTLTRGLSWYQASFDYSSQGINNTYETSAGFFEDRWKLDKDWAITMGSRYDHHSIIGNHTTSRVTINRQLPAASNVFLSWGQFVKAPLVEDMFSNTQWFVGNPDLKPETGETITLGGNMKIGAKGTLSANLYSSKVNNAIDYDYSGARGTAINVANQKRQGLDLTMTYALSKKWDMTGGYSYTKIQNKETSVSSYTNDPDNTQPNAYLLGFVYKQDKWNVSTNLKKVSGRSLMSYSGESYFTADLIANYQADKDTKLFFKALNITNAAYEVRGSEASAYITPGAYHMPGRTFIFGMERQI